MPQSFACLHHHFIFSTKARAPLISPDLQARLFAYLGGILEARDCRLLAGGGMPDHVHLLASLSKEIAVAEALRLLKANSSKWVHETFPDLQAFAWQSGYGAFAVSCSNLDAVRRYSENQVEHHRMRTFQEEFQAFLKRHGLTFDEKYLWD